MRQNATPACPLRVADHFVQRLHERFPDIAVTESQLQRELARADWYPAGGREDSYYAMCRLDGRAIVLVVALHARVAHLITVYEPRAGWAQRLPGARPWPMSVVLAASA